MSMLAARAERALARASAFSGRTSRFSSRLLAAEPFRTKSFVYLSLARCFSAASSSSGAGSGSALALPAFETLAVTFPAEHVALVTLNRPDKANAMNRKMWAEIGDCFRALGRAEHPCRAVILSGAGRAFTAGLDLMDHAAAFAPSAPGADGKGDIGRKAWELRSLITSYQASLTALEECPKPVIAAVHGACVGGGVDLICAADVRLASAEAFFCIKEAEIGLAADVGTLQRMPKICGNDSLVRELAFTARRMPADEALRHGFLSAVETDAAAVQARALAMASRIASLSPIAVQGTKINLNVSRDASTSAGLAYAAAWNAGMLQTADLMVAAQAAATGSKAQPKYPDLA